MLWMMQENWNNKCIKIKASNVNNLKTFYSLEKRLLFNLKIAPLRNKDGTELLTDPKDVEMEGALGVTQ